jgi:hypothetical protein
MAGQTSSPETPLRSDTPHQVYFHKGHHDARRRIVRGLLEYADVVAPPEHHDAQARCRKIAGRLTGCGVNATLYQDHDTGRLIASMDRCKSRLCPRCGQIRSAKLADQLRNLVKHIDDARFITLTLAHTDDTLAEQVADLQASFANLRRRAAWRKHVRGGLATVEIRYNRREQKWHPHLHLIVDGSYWPQADLAALWEKVTGASRIVDIRKPPSQTVIVRYLCSYASKTQVPTDLPAWRLPEWAQAVHGLRMMSTFGTLHAIKAAEPEDQPAASLDHVVYLEPLAEAARNGDPDAQLLYRRSLALARRGFPHDHPETHEGLAAIHRETADRIRTWWTNLTETRCGHNPGQPPNPHRLDRSRDGPQRQRQEPMLPTLTRSMAGQQPPGDPHLAT